MKLSQSVKLLTAISLSLGVIASGRSATATEFNEFAVDQSQFIAVAVPYNYRKFKLAIIEQVPGKQACWRESGNNPTTVDLLLLNFDHTKSCRKAVDTNGYSLRVNGKDDKVEYTLNLVNNNGQLALIADHQDPQRSDLIIGRTNGVVEAPMKIVLDPNWQFTKRLYQGSVIQHIYMSNNSSPQVLDNVATAPIANPPAQTNPVQVGTGTPQTQPVPTQQPTANQPNPAQTPTASVEGLITEILTPLSQAVYNTYNSMFTSPPANTQSAPNTSN